MVDVDTVVIGSGAGGLTAALALARAGQEVLVLEQHYLPGGWCHSFPLDGHLFSPGVHYIGSLERGGRLRQIYEGLGVAGDLTFLELNPDGVDHVLLGDDFRFDIPKGRDRYQDRLKARFPHEAAGIDGYMGAIARLDAELDALLALRGGPLALLGLPFKVSTLARYGLRSLQTLQRRYLRDPQLLAVVSMQCGDHGMPPSRAPAALHATVAAHYFNGGWYPMGGARAIPKAFIRALRAHGGEIKVRTRVDRILVEGGRAIGVRLGDGTEVRAHNVVSNADPGVTFGKLMDPADVPGKLRRKLRRTRYSASCMSLFMATDLDLRSRGMDSGNFWYSATPDLEPAYDLVRDPDAVLASDFPSVFLTCTTLKDPTKMRRGQHTLEAFALVNGRAFERWQGTSHEDRPADYEAAKRAITDRLLSSVERIIPGLRDHLTLCELGTPVTNTFYCEATQGSMYGTEKSRWQVGPFGFGVRTGLSGLTLCGASTIGHGVLGATMSGVLAAGSVLDAPRRELLTATGSEVTLLQAEDPGSWPDDVRKKLPSGYERRVA